METRHTPGCPGHEVSLFRAHDRNQRISNKEFEYRRCELCGLIRINVIPSDLSEYYSEAYYQISTLDRLAADAAKNQFKIDTVKSYSRPGRLLEIGPGLGAFAFQAKNAGYLVDAVEMDSRCCNFLSQQVGIRVVCSARPHEVIAEMGPHDVITLWHVIEHLPDPWSMLKGAADNLTLGGVLILATPNPQAWQFQIMGAEWPHVDAPRHLYLLPSSVLMQNLADLGFECVSLSATNSDARACDRYGWQKWLMNRVTGEWQTWAACKFGRVVAALLAPFDRRDFKGSAYTLIAHKVRSA